MKKLTLSLLIFASSLGAAAQDAAFTSSGIPLKYGLITYELVDTLDGLTKEQIYSTFKQTIGANFKNPKHVIETEDPASGKIFAKGTADYVFKAGLNNTAIARFDLTMMAKDGRYKIELRVTETGHAFVAPEFPGSKTQMRWRENALASFHHRMSLMVKSLQAGIKLSLKSDNW